MQARKKSPIPRTDAIVVDLIKPGVVKQLAGPRVDFGKIARHQSVLSPSPKQCDFEDAFENALPNKPAKPTQQLLSLKNCNPRLYKYASEPGKIGSICYFRKSANHKSMPRIVEQPVLEEIAVRKQL